MSGYIPIQKEPCAMCDKPDGGTMSSTAWYHNELCCSEECGVAYATSVKQAERNVARMKRGVALAQERLAEWEEALAHRLKLAATTELKGTRLQVEQRDKTIIGLLSTLSGTEERLPGITAGAGLHPQKKPTDEG